MYYAHSTKNPDKSNWQNLRDHLINVGHLSRTFADDFSAGDLAYASGSFTILENIPVNSRNVSKERRSPLTTQQAERLRDPGRSKMTRTLQG